MNLGFFASLPGFEGWSKRVAVTVILLCIWLGPNALAAAAGVLVPFPDKGEDRARHKRPVLPGKMDFPGTMSPSPAVPVQIHPLYPNDGAVFAPNAAVTFGWRMPDEVALPDSLRKSPKYFRVQLTSHTHPVRTTVKYFPYNGKQPVYTGIFNAPVSGRYGWQTTAVMDDGSIIKSPTRYFVVKDPYYYNHYFSVVPDVYPHYTYDSQDHRR